MPYAHDPNGPMTYDCKGFHGDCPSVVPILGPGYILLYCPSCRCLGHLDLVAKRIATVQEACKEGK